jgi:putative lipoic acid-binding regulatory protein
VSDDGRPPLVAYPCDYEYKVIGLAANDFEAFVKARIEGALGTALRPEQVTVVPSTAGKYLSVRVVVPLVSEEERVAVYRALSNQPRIVFYL